jgi:hypothetical protein
MKLPPFEEAKRHLKSVNYDVSSLLKDERFKSLTASEIHSIRKSAENKLNYIASKTKKDHDGISSE